MNEIDQIGAGKAENVFGESIFSLQSKYFRDQV